MKLPQELFSDRLRRAKARLTDMHTQEVSFVDAAANLRRWVVVKMESDMAEMAKAGLKLPAAAKQAMVDGLAQVLDKTAALAQAVGEAEVDDSAPVPPELGSAFKMCADMLTGMATQYAAAPAQGAPPPPPGAPPPPQAPPPQPGAYKSADGEPSKGDESSDVAKAGRKIAAHRLKALRDAHATSVAANEAFSKVLAEFDVAPSEAEKSLEEGDETDKAFGAEEEEPPVAGAPPKKKKPPFAKPGAPAPAPAMKNDEVAADPVVETAKAAETGIVDTVVAKMAAMIAPLSARIDAYGEKFAALEKAETPSNALPVEGGGAPSSRVVWDNDMSAAIRKKKGGAR